MPERSWRETVSSQTAVEFLALQAPPRHSTLLWLPPTPLLRKSTLKACTTEKTSALTPAHCELQETRGHAASAKSFPRSEEAPADGGAFRSPGCGRRWF